MAAIPVLPSNRPLGPNPYNLQTDPTWNSAYDECLMLQTSNPLHARCLGYLIIEAIDVASRDYITYEIVQCMADDDKLRILAELYIEHLFRFFRQNKGKTPAPSYHPSHDSFEDERFFFSATVDPAPKDHAAAKRSALRRDGYRCMVTRDIDSKYLDGLPPAEQVAYEQAGTGAVPTNLAHIFPPSTNWGLKPMEENDPKTHYSSTVWTIINNFAHINILNELDGDNVHKLSNVLTLSNNVHGLFDDLKIWFEAAPNAPHTYTVCSTSNMNLRNVPHRVVTFTSMDDLALPDPRYLKLHAAVCRVARMSGAAEYLDLHDREQETTRVMASDGTSADFLKARLRRVLLVA